MPHLHREKPHDRGHGLHRAAPGNLLGRVRTVEPADVRDLLLPDGLAAQQRRPGRDGRRRLHLPGLRRDRPGPGAAGAAGMGGCLWPRPAGGDAQRERTDRQPGRHHLRLVRFLEQPLPDGWRHRVQPRRQLGLPELPLLHRPPGIHRRWRQHHDQPRLRGGWQPGLRPAAARDRPCPRPQAPLRAARRAARRHARPLARHHRQHGDELHRRHPDHARPARQAGRRLPLWRRRQRPCGRRRLCLECRDRHPAAVRRQHVGNPDRRLRPRQHHRRRRQ